MCFNINYFRLGLSNLLAGLAQTLSSMSKTDTGTIKSTTITEYALNDIYVKEILAAVESKSLIVICQQNREQTSDRKQALGLTL